MFQYQLVVQLGYMKSVILGTMIVTMYESSDSFSHKIEAHVKTLSGRMKSNQRIAYLVTSPVRVWLRDESLVSLNWIYEAEHDMANNIRLPELSLEYIKLAPVAIRTGNNHLTRYFCFTSENRSSLNLKPFNTVITKSQLIC